MLRNSGPWILVLIQLGCASLAPSHSDIALTQVERLQMGKTTSRELNSLFGKPDRVLADSEAEETWIYFDQSAGEGYQRASFVIDKQSSHVQTAAWIPNAVDSGQSQQAAFEHFSKIATLKSRPLTSIEAQKDPLDKLYSDPKTGVSVWINKNSHTVSMVGFGIGSVPPLAKNE